MTIVKHFDKKSGKTRVYESTPHYDPVSKQSRPTRKYIGTLDPDTGEIIPSSGTRGRKSSKPLQTAAGNDDAADRIAYLERVVSEKEKEISILQSEITALKSTLSSYGDAHVTILNILERLNQGKLK